MSSIAGGPSFGATGLLGEGKNGFPPNRSRHSEAQKTIVRKAKRGGGPAFSLNHKEGGEKETIRKRTVGRPPQCAQKKSS